MPPKITLTSEPADDAIRSLARHITQFNQIGSGRPNDFRALAILVSDQESGEILGGRLEARGGVGLNATTTADATQFFGSLPASEIEFWLSLEAERLRHPILRRFYSERT